MWVLRFTEEYDRKLKQFIKKHPKETTAMLSNLDTYFKTLIAGVKPLQAQSGHGFIHTESHGAIAIDQKGTKGKPTQTRLYVYADADTCTLYLITVGDKKTQSNDNSTCREFIVSLREQKQNDQNVASVEEQESPRPLPDESDEQCESD